MRVYDMNVFSYRISPNFFDAYAPKDFKAAFVFCTLNDKTKYYQH